MDLAKRRAELERRNAEALAGGGPERVKRDKEAGKLARARTHGTIIRTDSIFLANRSLIASTFISASYPE